MRKTLINILRALGLLEPLKRGVGRYNAAVKHQRVKRMYAHFIKPGDLCFDVGANIGERTEIMLELGGKVVCLEPQQQCLEQLQTTYGKNPNVTIVPKALSFETGTAEISISDGKSGISTMSTAFKEKGRFSGQGRYSRTETIQTTTFDTVIAELGQPVFTKIDVEGFELNVLRGLTKPITSLSFEFAIEFLDEAKKCMERLNSIGKYEFNCSLAESMEMISETWMTRDELAKKLSDTSFPLMWGDIYARIRD